jgi:hypothetical protein
MTALTCILGICIIAATWLAVTYIENRSMLRRREMAHKAEVLLETERTKQLELALRMAAKGL